MKFTLEQIKKIIGGKIQGDGNLIITGVSSIENSKKGDISFIKDEKNLNKASKAEASALVVPKAIGQAGKSLIIVDHPFFAFTKLLKIISDHKKLQPRTIHPSATLAENVSTKRDVSIGANVVIGENTSLGDSVTIYPNVFIGKDCKIGDFSTIFPNVTILEEVTIGERVIIHPGTNIGGDGFGYLHMEGKHIKIPHIGTIEIGDDVEIGSNVTIDRAALDKTIISRGVKIDNHSHIAHNVFIGEDTMLIAYAKIAGSARIGKNVMIAEDVGITDHAVIGDNCVIGGGSKVYKSLDPGSVVWGSPAKPIDLEKRIQVLIKKLPEIYSHLKDKNKP